MPSNFEENRNLIFEATINVFEIPKGSSVEDIKQLLSSFKNEFYTERYSNNGQ